MYRIVHVWLSVVHMYIESFMSGYQ